MVAGSFARVPHPPDDTAVLALKFQKVREGGLQAHPVRISVVDAGGEWLGQPFERLAAEPAGHERTQRFVGVAFARRQDQVRRHPQHPERGEQPGTGKRPRVSRGDQADALRQVDDATAPHDRNRLRCPVDGYDVITEPQIVDQLHRPWLLGQPGIRSGLDKEATVIRLDKFGQDLATGPIRGLVDPARQVRRLPHESISHTQPGDPATYDGHIDPLHHRLDVSCTKSTSLLT